MLFEISKSSNENFSTEKFTSATLKNRGLLTNYYYIMYI